MARRRISRMSLSGVMALALATLVLPGCAAPESPVPQPDPAFLALSLEEQNLAVYDAFWVRIESNYYESGCFASDEWRTRRAQWRDKVAAQPDSIARTNVLRELVALMPDSHFDLSYPASFPKRRAPVPPDFDEKRAMRLMGLVNIGPGMDGVLVRRGKRQLFVVGEVTRGTLAEEAGIRPGWRILDSTSSAMISDEVARYTGAFVPLDSAAARAWERGEGSDAEVPESGIVRVKGDLRPFRPPEPFETRQLPGGVRYVRFNVFADARFMKPIYRAIEDAGPAGLVLDLRWNIGGDIEQVRQVAGALLGAGVFLGKTQDTKGVIERISLGGEPHYTGPLVVLIGPRSSSGAEVLAAAVQDLERGRLIGRMTNGSVLGAMQFPLPDTSHVTVPIMNWLRAGERRIEGVGVEPDEWLLPTLEDVRAGRDPTLDRALKELSTRTSSHREAGS